MRSSTLPVLNSLLTERILEIGHDLALHRAERALDDLALRIERKRERRGYGKHDCRGDLPVFDAEAVTKASAPTVTGCLSADAKMSAKTKLFQQKMKARSPAAAIPGPAKGIAMRVNVRHHE